MAQYVTIGNAISMDYNHTIKIIFDARPKGKRGIGRCELRWGEVLEELDMSQFSVCSMTDEVWLCCTKMS
jgi:hypothetical protein